MTYIYRKLKKGVYNIYSMPDKILVEQIKDGQEACKKVQKLNKKEQKSNERGVRMAVKIISKETRKLIERHFYDYEKEKKYAVENIIEATPAYGEFPVSQRGYSDPTGRKACDLVIAQSWCEVVEKTIQFFQAQDDMYYMRSGMGIADLIKMRYFEKRSPNYISRRQHISEATYYNRVDDIIVKAALYAKDYRLLPKE